MPKPRLSRINRIIPALLISALAIAWCWHAVGPGLGLFIAAPLLLTIITPLLVLSEDRAGKRWIAAGGCFAGAVLVLGISLNQADVTDSQWLGCSFVLVAYTLALAGAATTLATIRFPVSLAGALVALLGLMWLTWPVWLSPWMTQARADWLTPANPLLAINGVLSHLGTWDRNTIAYQRLTVLNQDVPYRLPPSIFPAVVLHSAIAIGGVLVGWYGNGRFNRARRALLSQMKSDPIL